MNVTSTTQTQYTQATNKTTATKATSAYDSVAPTQQTDKMAEMQEKYKDVYTPVPETYSKADEELQTQKVYEAYPKYVSFTEIFNRMNTLSDGSPRQLGQIVSQKEEDNLKKRADDIFAEFGGRDAYRKMESGVQDIKDKYPVNHWRGDNEKEFARFENAAVYEALESGKTVEEAKINARNLILPFMDVDNKMSDSSNRNFIKTLVKAGRAEPDSFEAIHFKNETNFNSFDNSTMDLRKYGIDGDWRYNEVLGSQQAMTSEIEKKITQFNFMLNNEDLMKESYSKLDAEYQTLGNNEGYKRMINETYMPRFEQVLDIFKNYKIYDSIDIKA